ECGGGAVLGLHQDDEPAATAPLRVELTLVSPEPLTLAGWLAEAGVPQTEAIVDEGDLHARPPDRVGG
ncbi:MAG: hypothetical protein JWM18_3776, partial [Chloroflexi bacterium]|nr:hypothetical protein [Chloroflexota bacterium]